MLVSRVGFHIGPGETYGLLGPNGAGKTTSISMIAGLLEPDAGEVLVAGEPMTTRSVRAKNAIGYVPQDLAIYPDLTGRENLMFFARLYSMPTPRPSTGPTRHPRRHAVQQRAAGERRLAAAGPGPGRTRRLHGPAGGVLAGYAAGRP